MMPREENYGNKLSSLFSWITDYW